MTESPFPMLPVSQALEIVLQHTSPGMPVHLPLREASGLILADDVVANEPLPPFPASVKDGYAVVADDGPGTYPVVGSVTAGQVAEFEVKPGTVAYITTGAPIPSGADAVIMVEETQPVDNQPASQQSVQQVEILTQVQTGSDIRPIGIDVQRGEQILAADQRLYAAEIGLLATAGVTQVPVFGKPKVAILSTGDELVEPDQPMGPGQIRDSNRSMLMAAIGEAGGQVIDLGIGQDERADLERRIRRGLDEADILITSGGVSMGDLDLLKGLLDETGQIHFGRIRMKPGKPLTFATAQVGGRKRLIFGLPGNPVSSLVTFYLFVVPALRKMAGWPNPLLNRIQAHLGQPLPLDAFRPEYHRSTVTWDAALNNGRGGYLAISTGSQASSRLLSMRTANALLELPQQEGVLPAGSIVTALQIGDLFT
ncbi:MAG: gephyrin-like molybdotransferase Glp [Chloroflexota bacterium]